MPQMAPYNWLILYMIFNLILVLINTTNHFNYLKYKNMLNMKMKNSINYYWIW